MKYYVIFVGDFSKGVSITLLPETSSVVHFYADRADTITIELLDEPKSFDVAAMDALRNVADRLKERLLVFGDPPQFPKQTVA